MVSGTEAVLVPFRRARLCTHHPYGCHTGFPPLEVPARQVSFPCNNYISPLREREQEKKNIIKKWRSLSQKKSYSPFGDWEFLCDIDSETRHTCDSKRYQAQSYCGRARGVVRVLWRRDSRRCKVGVGAFGLSGSVLVEGRGAGMSGSSLVLPYICLVLPHTCLVLPHTCLVLHEAALVYLPEASRFSKAAMWIAAVSSTSMKLLMPRTYRAQRDDKCGVEHTATYHSTLSRD